MNIRKLAAATAIAGGFVLASAGLASASLARTETNLAPGERVCVDLPATADAVPVRAEGFGDPGLTFTLTADGQLIAESAGLPVFTTVGAPGAVEFCASNGAEADAFVTLSLTSGQVQDGAVTESVSTTSVLSTPGPVVVSAPASEDPASDTPASAQSLVDQIQQLIDEIVDQVLAAVSAAV